MKPIKQTRTLAALLAGTALAFAAVPATSQTVDICALVDGVLPQDCDRPNGDTVVNMPAAPNTEWDRGRIEDDAGFVFVLDGEPLNADPRLEDRIRATDQALAAADIQVKFDGFGADRRLSLVTVGTARRYQAGETITFQSRMNYPAFVDRGELRLIDRAAVGGPRTVAVIPIDPNGRTSILVPEGADIVAVHRVYDARGRFDETAPVAVTALDARDLSDIAEEGVDEAVLRRIPAGGGSVTVVGEGLAPGAQVTTLGETVIPDAQGRFAIQRVLPAGNYEVDVVVSGPGAVAFSREVEIPQSEWFYVGTADLTLGRRTGDSGDDTFARGRVAFYAKGTTEGGYTITASIDTREEDLEDLLRNLDDRDPRTLFDRLDPGAFYPVYGDDSSFVEDAPTAGKVYLKIERDGNYLLWGNAQAPLRGSYYLRNERTLYGLTGVLQSQEQTSFGEARTAATIYAAQPDNLARRDVFRGTGGSIYFLSQSDIARGSETITVETRDADTGRVLSQKRLVAGRDYVVNYFQGSITLTSPLSGSGTSGIVVTPGGNVDVNLVVQYEFTPTGTDVDGVSAGGRIEHWINDRFRFGITAQSETAGPSDQTAFAADLRYRLSENSFVDLEYAESDGPGFGVTQSLDAGLIIDSQGPVSGAGRAIRLETRLDFGDLGLARPGTFTAYLEDRTAGFSTLDYQVTSDETLWGFALGTELTERLSLSLSYDELDRSVGDDVTKGYLGFGYLLNDRDRVDLGVEAIDRSTGSRTDIALRFTREASDTASWYVFAQATADNDGLDENNRVGVGGTYRWANGWGLAGELSGGDLGTGAKARVTYNPDENRSLYFGYELDPAAEFSGVTATTDADRSRFVLGGRRQATDRVAVFGENSYDLFGERRSLVSTYGVDYTATNALTLFAGVEFGQIEDAANGDFERTGLSFGASYDDGAGLTARGRLELRRDEGETAGTLRDSDTIALTSAVRYKIDEAQRLLFNLEYVVTDNDASFELDGTYFDASLGYALRPITNDRFNMLLRYRYLADEYGQRIDGTDSLGQQQRSHVFSADASYDLNQYWTLGGKIGARLGESRATEADTFAANDAVLGVVNARLHVVHNWDLLVEARQLRLVQAETRDTGLLVAGYRHFGNNVKVGLGYNFGSFSDDLTDLQQDDQGLFLNIVAKF